MCDFSMYVSLVESKNVKEVLVDEEWISAIQEELLQFERSKVWHLFPPPEHHSIIDTKWVSRNKLDEQGSITRNKAKLVVQGYH